MVFFHYRLHGMELESEMEFPEWPRAEPGRGPADVVLRFGSTPERLENPRAQGVCFQATPGELLCWLPGSARFHVIAGREIIVEAGAGVSTEALRRWARSSPMAGIMLQRGRLPLHASSVATSRGVVVFAGGGGVGKSTLAAELGRRGYDVLADDIAVFEVAEGAAIKGLRGETGVWLWPDAAEAIGVGRPGEACADLVKRRHVFGGVVPDGETSVAAIYILERGEVSAGGGMLVRLKGAEALAVVLDLVYRPAFVRGLGLDRQVFGQVATAVKTSRVMRLVAPAERLAPSEVVDRVEADLDL